MLAGRVDDLSRELVGGFAPMVVDIHAEAWRHGLPTETAEDALALAVRRGASIVCCPLENPEPMDPILPNDIVPGLSSGEVRQMLGRPSTEDIHCGEITWFHPLPFAGWEDDLSDGTSYTLRQAVWSRSDPSRVARD